MSVRVLRDTVQGPVKEEILNSLKLVPKVKELYRPGIGKISVGKGEVIKFAVVEEKVVHIPMATALKFHIGPFSEDETIRVAHQALMKDYHQIPEERAQFTAALRDEQKVAMETATVHLENSGGSIFMMRPGFGKTACTAYQIANMGVRALIFCHRELLLNQWMGTFQKFTKLNAARLGEKECRKKVIEIDWANTDVLVAMDTRLEYIPKEFLDSVGFLALDEAHLLCTPTRAKLFLCTHPRYFIACTATIEREDGMESMIYRSCGENNIAVGNTTPYTLYKVPTKFIPYAGDGSTIDWTALTKSLVTMEERNRAIVRLAAHLVGIPIVSVEEGGAKPVEIPRKVLIMTRSAEHVEVLQRMFAERGIQTVATLYRNKKTYRDSPILIGSMSKISVGFDEENACQDEIKERIDTLIQATSIGGVASAIQTFGRVFRSKQPEIYYFVDDFKTIEKHWRVAEKYASTSNGTVKTFNLKKFLDKPEEQ